MKEFRAKEGPYPLRLQYEISEIDDICQDALKSCALLPTEPQPIKVDRFLEKYFQVRVIYEDMEDDIMGCTIFDRKGRVTGFIVSPRIEDDGSKSGERRARSTLAHEGGHGLLHPKLFIEEQTMPLLGETQKSKPRFLCRKSDIAPSGSMPRYDGKWWEWQANRVIGGLLLPRRLVRGAVSDLLQNGALALVLLDAKRSDAERVVAEVFDVNPAVARIRLQEMFPANR
jgi:hypothetical protein